MIFVSGSKRSGTSMWMQVLAAAGVPVLGKAFPRNWKSTLADANKGGFYESILRMGVYWRTNPHPQTGEYFLPEHVHPYAVKVFVPGVIRSERSYIDYLIANVREWREYEASIVRLYAIEDAQRPDGSPEPVRFPPAYEWWMENFALVRDISIRRYPARLQSYDQVVRQPERYVANILAWAGLSDANVEAGMAAVQASARTQSAVESDSVPAEHARVFDDLYAAVCAQDAFSPALLATLNATNRALLPLVVAMQREVAESARSAGAGRRPAAMPTGLPSFVIDDPRDHPED